MNKLLILALPALLVGATATPAPAADVTEAELMQVATALAQQYDANYAAKNPAAMAALYASDGVLVAPSGSIVRGRQALTTYYANRFAFGARSHAIKVVEAHVQGNGGYGLTQFTVAVPDANGNLREEHGSIVVVYRRDADGWHMRLVEPSVRESADGDCSDCFRLERLPGGACTHWKARNRQQRHSLSLQCRNFRAEQFQKHKIDSS